MRQQGLENIEKKTKKKDSVKDKTITAKNYAHPSEQLINRISLFSTSPHKHQIIFFREKDSMLSASFIFQINLAENVKQLGFELGSRISTIKHQVLPITNDLKVIIKTFSN